MENINGWLMVIKPYTGSLMILRFGGVIAVVDLLNQIVTEETKVQIRYPNNENEIDLPKYHIY